MNKLVLSTIIASTMLLTACGGSGSSSSPSTTPLVGSGSTGSTTADTAAFALNDIEPISKKQVEEAGETFVNTTVTIGDKTYAGGRGINFANFNKGLTESDFSVETNTKGKDNNHQEVSYNSQFSGKFYLFKQDYSALATLKALKKVDKTNGNTTKTENLKDDIDFILKGMPTNVLPKTGTFHYQGEAHFYNHNGTPYDGVANYHIDFGNNIGSGNIIIDNEYTIELETAGITIAKQKHYNQIDESELSLYKIIGKASYQGTQGDYDLGVFGANAEEILGQVNFDHKIQGVFGGKKQ